MIRRCSVVSVGHVAWSSAFVVRGPGLQRVQVAFGPEKYARMVELKDRYDPHNLFRLNQNIPPSGWTGSSVLGGGGHR